MTQRGSSLLELCTVVAIVGIFAAVVVPGAAGARRALAGRAGAERLALVLRTAQAQAQASGAPVTVRAAGDGRYAVEWVARDGSPAAWCGELGVGVTSNYPGGAVQFAASGRPCLPASTSPRAGSFVLGVGGGETVVVQLSGCVRCR